MRLRRNSPNDQEREPKAAYGELAGKIEAGCLSPRMNPTGDPRKLARRISKLRENERRVLELAAAGRSNEEIARTLMDYAVNGRGAPPLHLHVSLGGEESRSTAKLAVAGGRATMSLVVGIVLLS